MLRLYYQAYLRPCASAGTIPRIETLRLRRGDAMAVYAVTENVVVAVTLGVRQGSPTSCLLFIIFVNDLIKMLKEGAGLDGFISWLHILVLMDDTVLIATTRENMIRKLRILKQYCDECGMKVNHTKTNFFVVNGSNVEKESIRVDDLVVEWCDKYVYLGSPFTADGSVSSVVRAHATAKIPHVLKFV